METWSERSTALKQSLVERVTSHINSNTIAYSVVATMNGFNDHITIIPADKNLNESHTISVIIGFMFADAELAVGHQLNNDTRYDLVTSQYLEFDNSTLNIPEDRKTDNVIKNNLKYYETPFTEREEEIFQDIVICLNKIIKEER